MAYTGQLVAQQLLAEQIFADAGKKLIYTPRIGALAAVVKETTSRINEAYSSPSKEKVIQLFHHVPFCSGSVGDAGSSCDITGTEPDSDSTNYTLTRTRSAAPFAINERKFETSMHEANTFVAENRLIQEKKLLEDTNTRTHAVINTTANKTNLIDAGWSGISDRVDAVDRDICISPSKWTIGGIAPLIEQTAARLMMNDPYVIDSGSMWELLYNVRHDQAKDQGKADMSRIGSLRLYMDWQMSVTHGGTQRFFLIDKGILSLLNRPDWTNTVPEDRPDDTQTWQQTVVSANGEELGPIMLNTLGEAVSLKADVRFKRKCATRTEYTQHWAMDLSADLVLAPTNTCTEEVLGTGNVYTGIVGFRCGDPTPAS